MAHNDRYSSARPICVYSENPETAKLIVYEHWYFRGEEREFLTETSNVGSRWNDRISSVKAVKGDWEIYQHFEFEGRREVISEGTSKNIRHNDHASSIRPLCSTYKMTCKLNKVKVIDNGQVIPTLKRTEIIGSQDGGSCLGPATHTLTLSNTLIPSRKEQRSRFPRQMKSTGVLPNLLQYRLTLNSLDLARASRLKCP